MKASARATKTTLLSQLVLKHVTGWVAYCNGSWWQKQLNPSEPRISWHPVDPLSLLPQVQQAANEESAQLFDHDYDTLAAELGNVRNFLAFLRLLKVPLTASSLDS